MKIPTPVIDLIEVGLNKSLQLDPATTPYLVALDQKVVQIHIAGLDLDMYWFFVDGEIEVAADFDGEADTVVTGTPLALAALSRDFQGVFSGEVNIEGDMAVGREVNQLLSKLEIDWEEILAPMVGGTAAHQFSRVHREMLKFITKNLGSVRQDVSEYMTEESRMVVDKHVLGNFLSEVDLIREDTDRLSARLELIIKDKNEGSK